MAQPCFVNLAFMPSQKEPLEILRKEIQAVANNAFFDVLVDQIIRDVRSEFDGISPKENHDSTKPTGQDDLVSRLLDFRIRRQDDDRRQLPKLRAATSPRTEKSEQLLRLEALMGSKSQDLDIQSASPGFSSAAAEVAFLVIARNGAKFHVRDFSGKHILPEALKRERRRLLLSLHPDRHPESEQKAAHARFLEVADAFTTLAETAMADIDDFAA